MIIDYRIAAQHHINAMSEAHSRLPANRRWIFWMLAVPGFMFRLVWNTTVCGLWGFYATKFSDLAQKLAAEDADVQGIRHARSLASYRVSAGIVGYRAWVDYCDECLAFAALRGNCRGLPAK